MFRRYLGGLVLVWCCIGSALAASPNCSRPFTLALHDHGLLYSPETDTGIDKDFTNELVRHIFEKFFQSSLAAALVDFQPPP